MDSCKQASSFSLIGGDIRKSRGVVLFPEKFGKSLFSKFGKSLFIKSEKAYTASKRKVHNCACVAFWHFGKKGTRAEMSLTSLTPEGYLPRIVDGQIDEYLKTFGAVEIAGTNVRQDVDGAISWGERKLHRR